MEQFGRHILLRTCKKSVCGIFGRWTQRISLAEIHRKHGVGRTTLQHCKRRLSGIFTLARNQGALDSPNPIEGAMIPKKSAAPAKTHAATPDEVLAILEILREAGESKARAAVALMFFAGLRPGEARGARWEDCDGKRLFVRQSVWHTFTTDPKTLEAGESRASDRNPRCNSKSRTRTRRKSIERSDL